MRRTALTITFAVAVAYLCSGCAWTNLQETNRRLKDSNDLLIAENNQLAQDLDDARKRLGELEAGALPAPAPAAPAAPPPRVAKNPSNDPMLIIDSMPSEVQVERSSDGIKLVLAERVFFSSGQAQLSTKGQSILRQIGAVLNGQYRAQLVRVDGHTDDVPTKKVQHIYPTNWELSTARACTVVRYLVDRGGVSPSRIYPAGFAFYRPRDASKGTRARTANRRVEITILERRA